MGLFDWLIPKPTPTPIEPGIRLVIDGAGVRRERAGVVVESVSWDDLLKVTIMTTDEGPMLSDVFFVLHGSNGGCLVPQDAPQSDALLKRLQELPGFDNNAVIQAMSCAGNCEFVCWNRTGQPI